MIEFNTLIYEKQDNTLTITLNRPEKLNTLNNQLIAEIESAIDEAAKDGEAKVIIITGAGRAFCAGVDVSGVDLSAMVAIQGFFERLHKIFNRLEELGKPTIAAINGLALGGGCELALVCDIRIASKRAAIGVPEIKLGVLPGGGGTQRLPRMVGMSKALEMLYTGDPVNAEEAYRIGLVSKVVDPDKLMDEAKLLANSFIDKPPLALKMAKEVVRTGANMDLRSALRFEIQCVSQLSSTEDHEEGIKAFLEKRKPQFKGR